MLEVLNAGINTYGIKSGQRIVRIMVYLQLATKHHMLTHSLPLLRKEPEEQK